MATELQQSFDALLTKLGQGLKCSDEFYKEGTRLAQRVFETLQSKKSKYSVSGPYFYGSFGKRTDVIEPDLDLVVVCNDVEPPLDEVVAEFENVLKLYADELEIQADSIKKTTKRLGLITFSFKNGMEVDLLPASKIADVDEIREKIIRDPKNAVYYSPSLVDTQVGFIKSQDSFTHTLIRLVKFWYKNLYFETKVFGGSSMMELVSVSAAEEEKKSNSSSMFRAFAKALKILSELDRLKLAFRPVADGKWERVPVDELQQGYLIPKVVGKKEILQQNCFIIEPANAYEDFLADLKPNVINQIKTFANATRKVLNQLVDLNEGGDEVVRLLFQPHPSVLVNVPSLASPDDLCICISSVSPYESIVCDMKVRKEAIMQDDRKKAVIEVLKARLLCSVNGAVITNPDKITPKDVQKAVEGVAKTSLQVNLDAVADHDKMDVTLLIPYRINDKGHAVRFSMGWV